MFRISQCVSCKHYSGQVAGTERQGCEAFPQGIPKDVWENKIMHNDQINGDGGIVFERRAPVMSPEDEEF